VKSPGYDEIIVKYSISATSKGFSVHHYPIAFYIENGITKQKAFFRECEFFSR